MWRPHQQDKEQHSAAVEVKYRAVPPNMVYAPLCQVILEGSRSRRTKALISCGVRDAGSVLSIPRRWEKKNTDPD